MLQMHTIYLEIRPVFRCVGPGTIKMWRSPPSVTTHYVMKIIFSSCCFLKCRLNFPWFERSKCLDKILGFYFCFVEAPGNAVPCRPPWIRSCVELFTVLPFEWSNGNQIYNEKLCYNQRRRQKATGQRTECQTATDLSAAILSHHMSLVALRCASEILEAKVRLNYF